MVAPWRPQTPVQGHRGFVRWLLALTLILALSINLKLSFLVITTDEETNLPPMDSLTVASTAHEDHRVVVSLTTTAPTMAFEQEHGSISKSTTQSSNRIPSSIMMGSSLVASTEEPANLLAPTAGDLSDRQQYSNATLCYLDLERKKHKWFDQWISQDVPLLDSVLKIVRRVSSSNTSSLSPPASHAQGNAKEPKEEEEEEEGEEVEEVYQVFVMVKHLAHDKQYWNQARWFCNKPDHPGRLVVSNNPVHVIECSFPLGRRRPSSISTWDLPSSTISNSSLLHTVWSLPPTSSDLKRTIEGMRAPSAFGTGDSGKQKEALHNQDYSNNTESHLLVYYEMVSEFVKCDDLEQNEFWNKMQRRGFYQDSTAKDSLRASPATLLYTGATTAFAKEGESTKSHPSSVGKRRISFPNFYLDPTVPTLMENSTLLPDAPQKIFLGACVIVREVGPLIRPWLEYHRLLGFEHFWIYVNEPFTEEAKGNQSWKRNRKHEKMENEDDITYIPYDFYWNNHRNHSPIYRKPKFNIFHQEPMQMKCLHHAKRWGVEWVTTTDVDEYIWVNDTRYHSPLFITDTTANTSSSSTSTSNKDPFAPASVFPLKAFLLDNAEKYRYSAGLTMNSVFFGRHPQKEAAKTSKSTTKTPLLMDFVYRHEKPKWQRYKVLYHPPYARIAEVHIVKGYPNIAGQKPNFNPRLPQVYFQHYKNAAKGVAKTKAGQRVVHDSALRDAYRARVLQILCGRPSEHEQHDPDCGQIESSP